MNEEGTKMIVRSVSRALDIIDFIANAEHAPSFMALQRNMGIPKSSLSNLLKELSCKEYIEYDAEQKGYCVGRKLTILSATIINRKDIHQLFNIHKEIQ